jgi:hypothetical protein
MESAVCTLRERSIASTIGFFYHVMGVCREKPGGALCTSSDPFGSYSISYLNNAQSAQDNSYPCCAFSLLFQVEKST